MNHPVTELPRPHGEGPPVPPMWQATLDSAALAQLFTELAHAAEIHSVQGKPDPKRAAAHDPWTLDVARDRLVSGELVAVQLRYSYDADDWSDTILRMRDGFRLIRSRNARC